MSNYPPGVTGNEPQIAGYDERDEIREVVECQFIGDMVVGQLRAWGRAGTRKQRRVSAVVCTFNGGDVDGLLVGDLRNADEATFFWECPSCGTENETTVDVGLEDDGPADSYWS